MILTHNNGRFAVTSVFRYVVKPFRHCFYLICSFNCISYRDIILFEPKNNWFKSIHTRYNGNRRWGGVLSVISVVSLFLFLIVLSNLILKFILLYFIKWGNKYPSSDYFYTSAWWNGGYPSLPNYRSRTWLQSKCISSAVGKASWLPGYYILHYSGNWGNKVGFICTTNLRCIF